MKDINIFKKLKKTSREYIESIVRIEDKDSDYRKIKNLFLDGYIDLKNFEREKLNVVNFEWEGPKRDRNWWWQLQALPFLNWYVSSYSLQTNRERRDFYKLCIDAINNWEDKTSRVESPLAWHDHAAAFRTRNIVNWMIFCELNLENEMQEIEKNWLSTLVVNHLEWLSQDENFSAHTNHGFDQAMISLMISLMFEGAIFESYQQKSRIRLKDELRYAFSEEGVHKENSPGYQKFMLQRLRQLTVFLTLGEIEFSTLVGEYLEKAEKFLKIITLPNGMLPLIGDTKYEAGVLMSQDDEEGTKKRINIYDYSSSGYVIVRGMDGSGKNFYILLKNCHDSNYHRHDDDMMIFLYYDGKVVFGDGGLYNHQENDVRRKNIRSFMAHSVPYISGKAIRDKNLLPKKPSLLRLGELSFAMQSSMFGAQITRNINIDVESGLVIDIEDRVIDETSEIVQKIFFVDEVDEYEINSDLINLYFPGFLCRVMGEEKNSVVGYKYGWTKDNLDEGAYVSKEYGILEPTLRIFLAGAKTKIELVSN